MHNNMSSKISKVQTLEVLDGNVLINIQPNKKGGWNSGEETNHSFYVPK